jgi:hypothetical protein
MQFILPLSASDISMHMQHANPAPYDGSCNRDDNIQEKHMYHVPVNFSASIKSIKFKLDKT